MKIYNLSYLSENLDVIDLSNVVGGHHHPPDLGEPDSFVDPTKNQSTVVEDQKTPSRHLKSLPFILPTVGGHEKTQSLLSQPFRNILREAKPLTQEEINKSFSFTGSN